MSDQIWYLAVDGKQEGPYKAEEIEERIRSGSVARGAHVYRDGNGQLGAGRQRAAVRRRLRHTDPQAAGGRR